MIDIKKLKESPDFYKESSKNKNLDLDILIDEILVSYNDYLTFLKESQLLRESLNKISKAVKAEKDNDKKSELILKGKNVSIKVKVLNEKISELKINFEQKASYIPNPSLEIVPVGKTELENIEIKTFLDEYKKTHEKPHWDILEENDLIMQSEASFLSGSRNVIYKGKAAQLIKAIEMFMLEEHSKKDYVQFDTPVFVNKEILFNTAQLPKMEDDLYKLEDDQYLIPTAEVTLTNLVANKIIPVKELPLKLTASTLCFRKEAGAAGRDTRGIIRLHQFRKVELVKIVNPKEKIEELNKMIEDASNILKKLKLPYRILQLVTGDISFGSEITYDLEVWLPSFNGYREISSISSMGNFQARRMQARFKDVDGINKLVTTLNGSGLAIDRTFAAILENYIDDKGIITVPEVLKKFVSFETI